MPNVNLYDKRNKRYYDKKKEKILREGERNRERIFQDILQNKTKGVMLNEISKNVNLSRQSTNEHLMKLLKEELIYKNEQRRYFPTDSIHNNVVTFAQQMLDAQRDIIAMIEPRGTMKEKIDSTPEQELYQYPGFNPAMVTGFPRKSMKFEPSPRDYLRKALSQLTLSEYFCKVNINNEYAYEKFLFEFASRLGAYITYIFIQSLYHIHDYLAVDDQGRKKLSLTLINEAIDMNDLFDSFRYNLTKLGFVNVKELDHKKIFELDQNTFNKISSAFRNIYPNLYRGFENYWYHPRVFWLRVDTDMSERNGCNHKWEQKYIFKFGKFYYCRKCHLYRKYNNDK